MELQNIRITGINKNYYLNQLETFERHMVDQGMAVRVEFGKQDQYRSNPSISLFDDKHGINQQKHFDTKHEMLGYVVGYNAARGGSTYL